MNSHEQQEVTVEITVTRGPEWCRQHGMPEGTVERYGPFPAELVKED